MARLDAPSRPASAGQVLVLFVLFLLVLLGISALAIDYASWLLTDRALQNVSDHAALAGASAFDDRTIDSANCSGGLGQPKCNDARKQAWASLSHELDLNLSSTIVSCMATAGPNGGDSPNSGELDTSRASAGGCTGEAVVSFGGHRIFVATPPPNNGSYTNYGGRYSQNFGVIWVRVDRPVRSFLGGALGIQPNDRTGWATAGSLPNDFALETFCRNHIAPQSGVCEGSAGIHVAGNDVYIRVRRGDVASNESLKVTGNNGTGVIIDRGNFSLVNGVCHSSTWNCPNGPPSLGGISDGSNGKNAFYMAPLPVPQFASPLGNASTPLLETAEDDENCVGADANHLCVPNRPSGNSPGDWSCDNGDINNLCGLPVFDTVNGEVRCLAQTGGSGTPDNHLDPTSGSVDNNLGNAQASPNENNANKYRNIDDDYALPDPDTTSPPDSTPDTYLFVNNLNHPNNPPTTTITTAFTLNMKQPFGVPQPGSTTIRYVAYKTNSGTPNDTGYPVRLTVSLLQGGSVLRVDPTVRVLTGTPTRYEDWVISDGVISDYNNLSLRFSFTSENQPNNNPNERGGAISWAEIVTPPLEPVTALPPMIPPGYYHSIEVGAGGCAIMDPTGVYSGLQPYQMPGIYRFEGDGSAKIEIGDGSALIGDGVTLVFDYGFPDPAGNKGIVIGDDGVLAINTARSIGVPTCTPTEPAETATYNPSSPLASLPMSSICAAWGVDPALTTVFRPGASAWSYCDPANAGLPQCVDRASYNPTATYRGVSFYFTPNAWPATDITGRFQQGGSAGATPGLAFRGVLYAPYDDVKMSGGCNGFNQIGQVLAWTTKFNGGCGYIELDYPYPSLPSAPYLLEPTIEH